jgi:hypothetical protein
MGPWLAAMTRLPLDHSEFLSAPIRSSRANSTLEYALGAAIAIALAREMSEQVEDDGRFFSSAVYISPEDLMKILKVPGPNRDCRSSSERLVIRGRS